MEYIVTNICRCGKAYVYACAYQVHNQIERYSCDTEGLDILWNEALERFHPKSGAQGASDSGTSRDWSDTRKRFRI